MSKRTITCCEIIRRIFNWFIQLTLLASITFLIITNFQSKLEISYIITPIALYIIFLINSFTSPTFKYLLNLHKANTIHEYMNTLFSTPPNITFHIECYHYKQNIHSKNKSKRKIITFRDSQPFYFYTWKDISGLFLLDTSNIVAKDFKQKYIKLQLNFDLLFANDGTGQDYEIQRNIFYARNRWRDQYIAFKESRHLPGVKEFNLVRVSDKSAPLVNCYVYILFVLLPFVEFYKIYVNHFCDYQTYTIKKIVSSRNDLNMPEFVERFQDQLPKIVISGEEVLYNQATINVRDSPYIPSEEDLKLHEQEKDIIKLNNDEIIQNSEIVDNDFINLNSENIIYSEINNKIIKDINQNPLEVKTLKDAESKLI
jgi:hypothetical protein